MFPKPPKRPKRQERAEYKRRRRTFLKANPWCEGFHAIPTCYGHACVATEVHHTKGRDGDLLLDEDHWTAIGRPCHAWIHQHPDEARKRGFYKNPERIDQP